MVKFNVNYLKISLIIAVFTSMTIAAQASPISKCALAEGPEQEVEASQQNDPQIAKMSNDILSLPMVKALTGKYFVTNEGVPSDAENYYTFKVGYDEGDHVTTVYWFHVYTNPYKIMQYNVAEDAEKAVDMSGITSSGNSGSSVSGNTGNEQTQESSENDDAADKIEDAIIDHISADILSMPVVKRTIPDAHVEYSEYHADKSYYDYKITNGKMKMLFHVYVDPKYVIAAYDQKTGKEIVAKKSSNKWVKEIIKSNGTK